MEFSLGGFDSYLTDREVTALRLHVCDGDYDFNTAADAFGVNTTTWSTTLDWSPPVDDPHGVPQPAGEHRRDGRGRRFPARPRRGRI